MTNQSTTNFEVCLDNLVSQLQKLLKALEEKLYEYPIVQQRLLTGDRLDFDFMCIKHSVFYLSLGRHNQSINLCAGFKSNLKACFDNQFCCTVDFEETEIDYRISEFQGLARSAQRLLRRRFSVIQFD